MKVDLPDLLRKAREGDKQALIQVLDWLYADPVLERLSRWQRRTDVAVAASERTSDVRQRGLEKLWKKFQGNSATIPEDQKTLLTRAVQAVRDERRDLAKHLRRYRAHVRLHEGSAQFDPLIEQTSVSKQHEREELFRRCAEILETLPFKDKSVIKAHKIDGHDFQEIAAMLNESVAAVRKRYGRAMQVYKERLRAEEITL